LSLEFSSAYPSRMSRRFTDATQRAVLWRARTREYGSRCSAKVTPQGYFHASQGAYIYHSAIRA